jgi:glyoxylase-like metal-dependent hydrolase (beta-lactamase superfamily II)
MTTRLGKWLLTAIPTGDFGLDGGAMFGVVPKAIWSQKHPADERNRIDMTMRALLIAGEVDGEERVILVDNGAGGKLTPKLQSIYRIDQSRYDLMGSLAAAGYAPPQITDVILTHLHFDHCGGSTLFCEDNGGSGERTDSEDNPSEGPPSVPTFPNATYHVQRRQWEWANSPSPRDQASFFPENFLPIEESGQLNLLDGEVELLPDLHLLVVDGHTPGLQLPLIHTVQRTFLYCADLFPTTSHIHLPYIMAYDLEPLKTLAEKEQVLQQATEEEWVLFFEHDASVECCHVLVSEKGFEPSDPMELADCS